MKFHICLSETNKKLGGVCGGIAQCFHFEPSIVRIIFVLRSEEHTSELQSQ